MIQYNYHTELIKKYLLPRKFVLNRINQNLLRAKSITRQLNCEPSRYSSKHQLPKPLKELIKTNVNMIKKLYYFKIK